MFMLILVPAWRLSVDGGQTAAEQGGVHELLQACLPSLFAILEQGTYLLDLVGWILQSPTVSRP